MKHPAKKISLGLTIVIAIVGIVLLFIPSIDMERYRAFTQAFAPLAVTLMISIGANSALEKFNKEDQCGERNVLDKSLEQDQRDLD